MWSWVGHRITGVVIFFLLVGPRFGHLLGACVSRGLHRRDRCIQNPLMALGETGLVAAIVFHALTACGLSRSTSGRRAPSTSGRCCGQSWACGS
ncbi:hypothetical protein [Arthrobacter sp. SD76]|uniref:hypothetical protein n=1 Tax=Arthrobacter sp. SD76 TaxID=3415007 RepID=UPI003C75413F